MSNKLDYVIDKRSPVGDLGIELEVEGKLLNASSDSYSRSTYFSNWPHVPGWTIKTDGSLRNGMEYVTRTPVLVSKAEKKISDLVNALKDNVTNDSSRTSCHVHVNCLKSTPLEIATAAMGFFLAEEILSDYWGEERKGNHYCGRISDSSYQREALITCLRNGTAFNLSAGRYNQGPHRYSALNFCALAEHGSLEFRGMRGALDAKLLFDWARTCHHIINNVPKQFKTPIHIFETYLNTSNPVNFFKKICGPFISDKLDFSEAKLEKVSENAIDLTEYAYTFESEDEWKKWEDDLVKERSKRKEKNTHADPPATEASTTTATTTTEGYTYIDERLSLPQIGVIEGFLSSLSRR